ncbi:MAG: tRNA (adenosine(37)-N6)-dimethylallyltransferase MiaA [Halothiobacillus sp. 14-56-357]|jgi:tRNA dimethylallyltransferase|nr:MAG: tRNA (adenosine(37)-N6)-dimethylallyltransferase MiaA [Halothiobacillus sp. 14-56-357]OZB77863.1 MAG: tRNA (adenosine(37)-N6)-dimethylallyltransferase MiaA [Halothiobacillus sp. 13-55-115]
MQATPTPHDAKLRLKPVLALLGPTASGKTAVALELAARYPVQIISVDSVMIYRDMNIGSAKPEAEVLAQFPHELVDICDPAETYSVSAFCRDALAAIERAEAAGKVPLLVGGTMMYFQALLDGISRLPSTDPAVRAEVLAEAVRLGWPALHAQLQSFDPQVAARVHPNDPQRIGRAVEVFRSTGRSLSQWQRAHPPISPLVGRAVHRFGLWPASRAHAREAMADRFDQMLAAGFVDEVAALRARGDLHPGMPAIRAVGYRQVWDYLDGTVDYDEMRQSAITATRQLAKRQVTWMRGQTLTQFYPTEERAALMSALGEIISNAELG